MADLVAEMQYAAHFADGERLRRLLREGAREVEQLRGALAAAEAIEAAVLNEGPYPSYHRHVMYRHRQQWPTLWAAIDDLLLAMKED